MSTGAALCLLSAESPVSKLLLPRPLALPLGSSRSGDERTAMRLLNDQCLETQFLPLAELPNCSQGIFFLSRYSLTQQDSSPFSRVAPHSHFPESTSPSSYGWPKITVAREASTFSMASAWKLVHKLGHHGTGHTLTKRCSCSPL